MHNTNCNCSHCNCGGSTDHEYGYNAMLPMQALQPTRTDVETLKRYCGGKNPVSGCNPNNLTGCHQCCMKNCGNDCTNIDCQMNCSSLCKQSKPPSPIGPDGNNAADYCSTQVHPNMGINCHHNLNDCCVNACHGDQDCVSLCNNNADHCCTMECTGEGPPGPGPPGPGPPGPGPPGPDPDNGKGGNGGKAFLDTIAGKITLGVGVVVLVVLIILAVRTYMKNRRR